MVIDNPNLERTFATLLRPRASSTPQAAFLGQVGQGQWRYACRVTADTSLTVASQICHDAITVSPGLRATRLELWDEDAALHIAFVGVRPWMQQAHRAHSGSALIAPSVGERGSF